MSDQRRRRFRQVDVFTTTAYAGNPVAVVLDGEGLTFEQMARFTRWTNLSEATCVVPPTRAEADYRVRIFTSASTTAARAGADWEVPFAGHPTLGTCHAWLEAGGRPRQADVIIQECGDDRHEVQVDLVGHARGKVLADRTRSARDHHVLLPGSFTRLLQGRLDAVRDE